MATGHANSKRKRGSTFVAPEPILLATYMTYFKISITSSQEDRISFFNKYFKDPPHYSQLLTGQGPYGAPTPAPIELPHVLSGDNSSGDDGSGDDNSCGDEGERDGAGNGEGEGEGARVDNTKGRGEASTSEISSPSKNHRSLVFSENMRDDNRTKAFLALKFLRDRLRLEARLEGKNFTFKIVRGGAPLRELAHDIAVDMPALNDITDNYLFALFTTMI
ncbi:hypothetical protein BGX24_000359 [Mortierella sp. AD032]|nr:hypothetical protein BGX24_000359 [Mortierella sp. AD032]